VNTFDFEQLIPTKTVVSQEDYWQIVTAIEAGYVNRWIDDSLRAIRKARNKAAKQRRARTGRK
jgi:hypothetical protein